MCLKTGSLLEVKNQTNKEAEIYFQTTVILFTSVQTKEKYYLFLNLTCNFANFH